jgi:hypothetical protein
MAPGSRRVRAVFLHLFCEDSGETGDVAGEPRVQIEAEVALFLKVPDLRINSQ